jgi:rfaE bifunctional protein nucleotidyltransferase chain/domain
MLSKILDIDALEKKIVMEKQKGKKIVFSNGCFDICHAGHVRYLQSAASKGDILVLGINSDASVNKIKGNKRPVVGQEMRAEVMAALACIDYVVIFDEPDPYSLIKRIKPDVLVKGADWEEKDIIGADIVKADGGRIERIKLVADISTTLIIEKILRLYKND